MSRAVQMRSAALAVGLMLVLAWVVCCDSSRPSSQPAAPDNGAELPKGAATSAPASSSPAADAGAQPPHADDADQQPKLPDYLKIVERHDASEPGHVDFRITSRRRLEIETRNVRRLRIERSLLPMDTDGSIVLRLDGQGIEWTARSTTVEFERSANGAWTPVREQEP